MQALDHARARRVCATSASWTMFGDNNGYHRARFGPDETKWPPRPSKWNRRKRIGKCVVWWMHLIVTAALVVAVVILCYRDWVRGRMIEELLEMMRQMSS